MLAFVLTTTGASRAAMDPAEKARRAAVVAHVGSRVITAGELEDRLAMVPRFQLTTFGATPEAIRRGFLDQVLVPEALYALGAEAAHLESNPELKMKLDAAMSNGAVRALRAQLGTAASIPDEDVKRYYDSNRSRYDTPERYMIWRILCARREEAVAVLEAARKDTSVAAFNALARDHSIDKATNQRGGNLGAVTLDGVSSEAGLRVDPAIVKAAMTVKEGDLVPQPVPEGPSFAVVWRRGTIPALHRTVDQAAAQIRDTLWKEREEQALRKLVADLRATSLHDENEALLDGIEVSSTDGSIVPRHRPGQVPPISALSRSIPK